MAIWQFDLSFVPHGGTMPRRTSDGHEAPAVQAEGVTKAQAWLTARFGEPLEMLEGWFVYGPQDGNRVNLTVNQDGTAEISARIDARTEASKFISSLCELSAIIDSPPFSLESWKLLEAKPSAIGIALERSRAATFIRDPETVLRGAGSGA